MDFTWKGITVTFDDIIEMVEQTSEDAWQVDVVRSTDGTRNCFFGHLHHFGVSLAKDAQIPARHDVSGPARFASSLWDWFEEAYATTYAIYPVNDGTHPGYPQPTPRQRVLAYLQALASGDELTTHESIEREAALYERALP